MAILYFRPIDPCDLRCAMMRIRVGNYYVLQAWVVLPWPYYIFDLLIPAICDAR